MPVSKPEERVLIVAPIGQDAAAMAALLSRESFQAEICDGPAEASRQLAAGAGALLFTDEALELPQVPELLEAIKAQPAWSELPLIILTRGGESRLTKVLDLAAKAAGSVTLLERPLSAATLLRSVEVALRSRRRQYQVRDLLEEQERKRHELEQASETLRRAKEFDEAVIHNMGEGLYTVDSEGLVTSMSPAAERLFGWTLDELRGRTMHDATHYKHPDGSPFPASDCAGLQVLLHGTSLVEQEDVFIRKDGTFFDVVYSSSPLREGSRITGLVVVFRDVTERKQAEVTKAKLAAIVESSEDAIISKDLNSIITSWNRGAERLFGYSVAEAVGQPVTMLMPPERIDEEPAILDRIRRGERIEHYETIRRRKDGTLLDISLTVSPITDVHGKVVGVSKIARDNSARTQTEAALREGEERYRTLVAQVKDYAIFRTDNQGRPTSWNEGVRRVFGFEEVEFLGQDVASIIFTPEDVQAGVVERELREAAVKGTATNDRWLRRKDGSRFYGYGVTTGLRNEKGEHIGYSNVVRDETSAKLAEQALAEARAKLQEHAANLEKTVAARTYDLRTTNEQLEAFVYSIAHDLRAPLRSMIGYSQLLVEDYASKLDETAQQMLKRIQASSEFMDKLLMDLLAYGRTARAEVDLGPVELRHVWESALFQCSNQIEQSQAHIETIEPLPVVRAHEATLGQCLTNLLSNALKFVAPGVRPRVRCWAEHRGDYVRVSVEDNGIGIPIDQQERAFRVFERLHGSRYLGTGIGLSIVRKGIERMGGRVGVESAPGKGSRFWIELAKAN